MGSITASFILITMQILFFCEDSSGEPNFAERNFWHASCSARGVYIDGSRITTLFFYASLLGVCVALISLAYHACFRLFTRSVLRSTW
nr:envelope glycoprotein N [Human alphaherpesvirus 3]